MFLARRAHLFVAVLFVAGVVVQVFLAGLGVFDRPERFATHRDFGFMLELLPILMVILAVIGRSARRQIVYAVSLFAMFLLQSILVELRGDYPAVAALHPVNGFAILLLGIVAARGAWSTRTVSAQDRPVTQATGDTTSGKQTAG